VELVEPPQEDPLAQRPRADLDAVDVERAHRPLREAAAAPNTSGPLRASRIAAVANPDQLGGVLTVGDPDGPAHDVDEALHPGLVDHPVVGLALREPDGVLEDGRLERWCTGATVRDLELDRVRADVEDTEPHGGALPAPSPRRLRLRHGSPTPGDDGAVGPSDAGATTDDSGVAHMPYYIGGGILYLVLMVTLGVLSIRKGHWILFLVGILLPFLWLVGAVMPPTRRVRAV